MNEQMSVVLGTVAMEPKGEYSAEAYYEKLNTVLYNDSTYMAIKPSHNILPTDTEYWQLIGGGAKKEEIVQVFDTVADMKLADLKDGMTVQTLGYYEVNDGGGATYKITDEESQTPVRYQEELNNGLYAELITNKVINVKQFGARGINAGDDTQAFANCINYCNNTAREEDKNIYIPRGMYIIRSSLPKLNRAISLIGEKGSSSVSYDGSRSIIKDLRENSANEYLIKYNQESTERLGASIYDITFRTMRSLELNCIEFKVGGYKSIMNNVVFCGYKRAIYVEAHDSLFENVGCYNCGGQVDNSNDYAITIRNTVVCSIVNCLIEHTRFMIDARTGVSDLVIDRGHFEQVDNLGFKGDAPIIMEKGTIINSTLCARPVKTIADEMNDTIDNVYPLLTIMSRSRLLNNWFTVGGTNSSTQTDTNKKQAKYLQVPSSSHDVVIKNNFFSGASFETPSIICRYCSNVTFSDNIIFINAEEVLSTDVKDKYVIDNLKDSMVGENNLYHIRSTLSGVQQFEFLPRLTNTNVMFYELYTDHLSGGNYSDDRYSYSKSSFGFINIPTLVVQGTSGIFELEIFNKDVNEMYYKGIISFNIADSSTQFSEVQTIVKKISGRFINFIKQDNKLIIQVRGALDKNTYLVTKINNVSRKNFVYRLQSQTAIENNIIGSITAS